MPTTIYHNPNCGTSRNVLAILEAAGTNPTVIDYLQTGWTKPQLFRLLSDANITAGGALRTHKTNATDLGLTPDTDEDALINAMIVDPILVNRPFVITAKGTALCRPSHTVLDLLDTWPAGPYQLEDGTPLIDAAGNRTL